MPKINQPYRLVSTILLLLISLFSFGEGTREIRPTNGDRGYLMLHNSYGDFARYDASEEWRLHIKICEAGEVIHIGFRQDDEDVNMRLKDPNGNIVIAQMAVPTAGDEGYIATHAEAVAGPEEVIGAAGYDAITYTSLQPGDYYLELDMTNGTRRTFEYFDITVSNATQTAVLPGRVWSKSWTFSTGSFTNQFEGSLYVYSDDKIVTYLEFNGMQPYVFVVAANPNGVQNTGNFFDDRRSVTGLQTFPQYKVFLNDPDSNCYDWGEFGSVTEPVGLSGCGENKCIDLTVDQAGAVLVTLDFNGVAGFQENTADVQVYVDVDSGYNCVPWNTRDNLGNLIGAGTTIDVQVDYLNGITHLPLYDVEEHDNGYTVTLTHPTPPGASDPLLFYDDSNLGQGTELTGCGSPCHTWGYNTGNVNTINTWWYANIINDTTSIQIEYVTADADTRLDGAGISGNDTTICSNSGPYQLSGDVTGATGGIWRTFGTGTFSDSLDHNATYTPSADDYAAGSVIITINSYGSSCTDANDSLLLNLTPGPIVDAGLGDTLCETSPNITLNGTYSNVPGIRWILGNGTFIRNRRRRNAQYNPSSAEVDSGYVTLVIRSRNEGVCPREFDTVTYYFDHVTEVNAGNDTAICSSANFLSLNGLIDGGDGTGTWSGGNGTFDSGGQLSTNYNIDANDLPGPFNLTLTSNPAGVCPTDSDDIEITFNPATSVNAFSNAIPICITTDTVDLSATVSGTSSTLQWSGGNGDFIPDDTSSSLQYIVNPGDTTGGVLTLFVETDTLNGCSSDRDSVVLSFNTPPTVSISPNTILVCANRSEVTVEATVTNASSGTWTGGGGTFAPSADSLSVTYTPSQSEINFNFTALTYTASSSSACEEVSESVNVIILPEPTVNAGSDDTICTSASSIALTGTATNSNTFYWSGGSGTFDDSTSLSTNYNPTAAELSTASPIALYLHANQDSTCSEVIDTMMLNFQNPAIIDAGPSLQICENNLEVILNGALSGATGMTWSGGNGDFDDQNSLITNYNVDAADVTSGSVVLTATADQGLGVCPSQQDTMTLTFTPAPIVDAGDPITVCRNNIDINLNASISGGATQGIWYGGDNDVSPSVTTLTNASYIPSNTERNSTRFELYLMATDTGNCLSVIDTLSVTITDAPQILNFASDSICQNTPDLTLSISVTVSTGIQWSNGLGTYDPDNQSNAISYTPSASEVNAGEFELVVTTTGNGSCNAVTASQVFKVKPAPIVNAGTNIISCVTTSNIQLAGTFFNATSATWETLGDGSFTDLSDPLTTYNAGTNDIDNRAVDVVLNTTDPFCPNVSDTITIEFEDEPSVSAGGDINACSNEFPVLLNASGSPGSWSGGLGSFSPNANTPNALYTPTSAEITTGTIQLTYTAPANTSCPEASDFTLLTLLEGPTASAGSDFQTCSNDGISLTGTHSNSASTFWETLDGSGSFSSSQNIPSILYMPNDAELSDTDTTFISFAFTANGNSFCPLASDTITVAFLPIPTIFAGPDVTHCGNGDSIQLSALATNFNSISWSGGAGSFSNSNALSTNYLPTATEISAGTVTLTLNLSAMAGCSDTTDDVTISLDSPPTIDIGNDIDICGDSSSVELTSILTTATSAFWITNGTGSFVVSPSGQNTSYEPSVSDITSGSIQIYAYTVGNGVCDSVIDSLTLTITEVPDLSAGPDTTLCGDADPIALSGSHSTAITSVQWTSSNGTGLFTDDADTSAIYTLSSEDITDGFVTLTLTSTNSGQCQTYNDEMIIFITDQPTVFAGFDQDICVIEDSISLTANITVSNGVEWSTLGDGSFSNSDSLVTFYVPGSGDTATTSVNLIATTTGNGNCRIYTDTLTVFFQKLPTANAGSDFDVCADSLYVALNGAISGSTSAEWSALNPGVFAPNNASLSALYQFSGTDLSSTNVPLTLTTTDNGNCPEASDDIDITVLPIPVVTLGSDTSICSTIDSVALNGLITNAGGGRWTTSGTGTFVPNDSTLNAHYLPSSFDRSSGIVQIRLTSIDNGLCNPVNETFSITFVDPPSINAGADVTLCRDSIQVSLNPTTADYSLLYWSTNGTGPFGPDSLTENATFYPSDDDALLDSLVLTLTLLGNADCPLITDDLTVFFQNVPLISVTTPLTICADDESVSLNAVFSNAGSINWVSSGTGSFTPSDMDTNPAYVLSTPDKSLSQLSIVAETQENGVCASVTDTTFVTILEIHEVEAGPSQTLCADADFIQLDGAVTNALGGFWLTTGNGSFAADSTNLSAQYDLATSDRGLDSIAFTLVTRDTTSCDAALDQVVVYLTDTPQVDAGSNFTTCLGADTVFLTGNIEIANGGRWTTDGNGSFDDNENLNTFYLTDPSDEGGDGILYFTLESTGNGDCNIYEETIEVTFSALPPIDAGPDSTVCNTEFPVPLFGSGAQAQWSGGLGTFFPNNQTLDATYFPTSSDSSNGFIKLYLNTINNGSCTGSVDSVTITFNDGPLADAGLNQTICTNEDRIELSASISNSSTQVWSTNGTGSIDDENALSTFYNVSDIDKQLGQVDFTVTSTDNDICQAAESTIQVSIINGPVANAGFGQTLCASIEEIPLSGFVQNATGGLWSGGSDNFTTLSTDLTTSYLVDAADTTNGSVTLELITTGHPLCNTDTAEVTFTFEQLANIEIGGDLSICTNIDTVSVSSTTLNISSVQWSTDGTGNFSPSNTGSSVTYIPGDNEIDNTPIQIIANGFSNTVCPNDSDTLEISITPAPIVSAGTDTAICSVNNSIVLNSSVTNENGIAWITSGSGSFSPDTSSINVTYNASSTDISNGFVTLGVAATSSATCIEEEDYMLITFIEIQDVLVNAGVNIETCADADTIPIFGFISKDITYTWETSGSGMLLDTSGLSTAYAPDPADVTAGFIDIWLTAFDPEACGPVTDTMRVTFTDAPILDIGNDLTICEDTAGVELSASFTVSSGVQWVSSGTGSFALSATDTLVTYIPSDSDVTEGTITISASTTGNGTCESVNESIELTILQSPEVNAGDDINVCGLEEEVAIMGTLTNSSSAEWSSTGNGNFDSNTSLGTTYTPDVQDIINGAVVLTLTTLDHGLCRVVEDQVNVIFQTAPQIVVGLDKTICETDPITINAAVLDADGVIWSTNNGSGNFSNPDSTVTLYQPSDADGELGQVLVYAISTGNGLCPSVKDSLLINVEEIPELTLNIEPLCDPFAGSSLTASVNNANGGSWSTTGDGSFSSSSVDLNGTFYPGANDISNGTATITLTSSPQELCLPVSTTSNIEIIDPVQANAGADAYTCTGSNYILSTTPENDISYSWYEIGSASTIFSGEVVNVTVANTTSYLLLAMRNDGCVDTDTVTITTFDLPTVQLDAQSCFYDSTILEATLMNEPTVPGLFQWYRDGVFIPNANGLNYTSTNTGTFSFTYSYAGCVLEQNTVVTPLPDITASNEVGCKNDPIAVGTDFITGYTYEWSIDDSSISLTNEAEVITMLDSVYVLVEAIDTLGCLDDKTIKVFGLETPTPEVQDAEACINETIPLDGLPSNIALFDTIRYTLTYSWSEMVSGFIDSTRIIDVGTSGDYIVTTSIEQCSNSDTVNVIIYNPPVGLLPDDFIYCELESEFANLVASEDTSLSFLWSTGDTTSSIQVDQEGFYSVVLTSAINCVSSDSTMVEELCEPEIFIPNGFTPGSGGTNGVLAIFGHHISSLEMTIYNRWGEVIYVTNDKNQPWDGYYRGELMPIGTYPWVIEYEGYEPYVGPYTLSGSVTIVR